MPASACAVTTELQVKSSKLATLEPPTENWGQFASGSSFDTTQFEGSDAEKRMFFLLLLSLRRHLNPSVTLVGGIDLKKYILLQRPPAASVS